MSPQVAFEIMSVLAVVTNCALLALTPQGLKYDSVYGDVNYILFFVIAEVSYDSVIILQFCFP